MSISSLPQNPLLSQYMPPSHNPSYSISQPFPSGSSQALPQIPTPTPQLSAAITRILTLSDFPATLKTRDLQNAFSVWEAEKGGFKIKWIDDVTALVVFADAGIAKKAYLSSLLAPPPSLAYPATIRPYDGPDAQAIIQAVNSRTHGGAGHRGSIAMGGVSGGMSIGGSNPFGVAMGLNAGAGAGGKGVGQAQGQQVTNGFQIPQPVFGGEANGNGRMGGHHVRASSVSSASVTGAGGAERTSTLATRMAGPSAPTNGGGGQHHRAMSNSSATGSWGRQSISGVLGFGGSNGGGSNSASNGFNNPNTFGSYGAGGNSNGAHSLPPLPLPTLNTSTMATPMGQSRLTTHLEVDTPAATPARSSSGPGGLNGYFSLGGSAVDTSQRSGSAASDRSGQGEGQGQGRGLGHTHGASTDDLVSPALEIRGGNHLEGMTSVTTSPSSKGEEGKSNNNDNTTSNSSTNTNNSTSTARRVVRTTAMPAARGSAAFGSGNGVFGGSSFGGGGGGGGGGGHARKESQDAGSAEKALDEVKKALQGLGVAG